MYREVACRFRLIGLSLPFLILFTSPMLAQSAGSESEQVQIRIDAASAALARLPHLKRVPQEKIQSAVEFVAGNTLFVLLHEMGHALIADMELPVLGQEEDAADSFAIVTMLKVGTSVFSSSTCGGSKGLGPQ